MIPKILLNKNYYIIFIIFCMLLILTSWSYNIYMNIKSGQIALPISVIIDDNSLVKEISLFRITQKNNKVGVNLSYKNTWIIENTFVKDIFINIPISEIQKIKNITVLIGKKKSDIIVHGSVDDLGKGGNFYNLKISDHVNFNKSVIPFFKKTINWPGDLIALIRSFPSYHFFLLSVFILGIIYNNNNKKRLIIFFVSYTTVFIVTIPLLDIFSSFYFDWGNHIGYIGYNGNYLVDNGMFPLTINSNDSILNPNPLFYGYLFYPLSGTLSTIFSPSVTLRMIVFILLFIQFNVIRKLVFYTSNDSRISNVIGIIMTFSVYPLTNLYNRSAIPEFAASVSAVICLCFFLIVFILKRGKTIDLIYFFLFYIICAGTHPITFFYFSCILLFLFLINISSFFKYLCSKKNLILFGLCTVSVLFILFPWLFSIVSLNKYLNISSGGLNIPACLEGIDSLYYRFTPVLNFYDERVKMFGIDNVSTPYLDTQTNISIIILLVLFFVFSIIKPKTGKNRLEFLFKILSFGFLFILFTFMSFILE